MTGADDDILAALEERVAKLRKERNLPEAIFPYPDNEDEQAIFDMFAGPNYCCPFCQSEDLDSSNVHDGAGDEETFWYECETCGAAWYTVYQLAMVNIDTTGSACQPLN